MANERDCNVTMEIGEERYSEMVRALGVEIMKTVNPEPKVRRYATRKVKLAQTLDLLDIQLKTTRDGGIASRVDGLRKMLASILLVLPYEASQQKKADLETKLRDAAYNGKDSLFADPDVSIDDDLIQINGCFSIRELAKHFQW